MCRTLLNNHFYLVGHRKFTVCHTCSHHAVILLKTRVPNRCHVGMSPHPHSHRAKNKNSALKFACTLTTANLRSESIGKDVLKRCATCFNVFCVATVVYSTVSSANKLCRPTDSTNKRVSLRDITLNRSACDSCKQERIETEAIPTQVGSLSRSGKVP